MDYNTLKHNLYKFTESTKELIDVLNKEKYDELENILKTREDTLQAIGRDYNIDEFKAICNELEIMKFEKKATELMAEKKEDTRNLIEQINRKRNANRSYNNMLNGKASIFSKKV